MSKLMLTRASTVVLKNRRRYSVRARNARPRRQSAPTVLQRTPASPRGHPAPSPSPVPLRQKGGDGRTKFTYPHLEKDSGTKGTWKENYSRRGSVQPHLLQQQQYSSTALATTGVAAAVASTGLSNATATASGNYHPNFNHHHHDYYHHHHQHPHHRHTAAAATASASSSINEVVASANAELARVQVDSPKLKRITFQDCVRGGQAEAPSSLPCFPQLDGECHCQRNHGAGLEPRSATPASLQAHLVVGCDLYPPGARGTIFRVSVQLLFHFF